MGIINPKYNQLKPELRYLSDHVVLAQAWKKTHSYIRSHNWYADTLELDASAVNLQANVQKWSNEISALAYQPSPMKMVLAPKSDHWNFYKDKDQWIWGPEPKLNQKNIPKELRPLAHINIQDQTIGTAIMLCLADAIETAQGSTDPGKGHKVWSYGNRLFCNWEGTQAHFRWGNSSTYSKYFQDYQRFLDRPIKKAQEVLKTLSDQDTIYEIHLDLNAFYDTINKRTLLRTLKRYAKVHYETDPNEWDLFWEVVETIILGWKWRDVDLNMSECLKKSDLNNVEGLPQGMVASGFFANAYLISLDNRMSRELDKTYDSVTLIDYCRYVDDMRLLVRLPSDSVINWEKWVKKNISIFVTGTKGLTLNLSKTKVERFTAKRSGVSVRMKSIQSAISGPMDMMALDEIQGSLEGLITLAEQFRDNGGVPYDDCDIPLSKVDQPQMDVREDTLLRFAANRLVMSLLKKRTFSYVDETSANDVSELDHVYESVARRFVSVWSKNPSLVAILKKGLQLYPHPSLLKPILDSLQKKLSSFEENSQECSRERYVAIYCLSEVYRFAALVLQRQKPDERPKHSDIDGLIACLIHSAHELNGYTQLPWYLWQQIALFMAVNEEPISLPNSPELNQYRAILRVLNGDRRFSLIMAVEKRLPIYIIAFQISRSKEKILTNMSEWISNLKSNKAKRNQAERVIESLALNQPDLFEQLLRNGQRVKANWINKAEKLSIKLGIGIKPLKGKLIKFNDISIPLSGVIKRQDNPFSHENAFINLAIAALNLFAGFDEVKQIPPHSLNARCLDWSRILYPDATGKNLILEYVNNTPQDDRFRSPGWLSEEADSNKLYALGSLLRSCVTGELDFTVGQYLISEDVSHAYLGVKSTWFKRRIGMAHQPEALVGYAAPMSSWVSELLYRLLQWPGLEIRAYDDEWLGAEILGFSLETVRDIITERVRKQAELYGKSSEIPVYVERILNATKDPDHLRIVMAQSLLPKKEDFLTFGTKLDTPSYRARHSNHVATMARLICNKLIATSQAAGFQSVSPPLADLIVFPELSIHEKDIDTLMRLADKTGAMIFCGLVFREEANKIINTALWLIPFKTGHGRQWIMRYQGKKHLTVDEKSLKINPWREYQLIIELSNTLHGQKHGFRISGSICYDATDISLAADLKDVTNAFLVPALNRDIDTFDTMVDALHYHMFQPVVLVNSGQFGGSAARAPYKEKYHKLIAHAHGNNQIAISIFDLNMHDFGEQPPTSGSGKEKKTPPAGLKRNS